MTENEMSSGSSEAALLCDQMFHHNQNCTTNEQWQNTDVFSLKFTVSCQYRYIQKSVLMITKNTPPIILGEEQLVKDWMKMEIYNQKFNCSWDYWWIKGNDWTEKRSVVVFSSFCLVNFGTFLPTGQHDEHHTQVSWGSRMLLLMWRSFMCSRFLCSELTPYQLIKILWQSQSLLKPEKVNIWTALQNTRILVCVCVCVNLLPVVL